jgi:hypothetical protein
VLGWARHPGSILSLSPRGDDRSFFALSLRFVREESFVRDRGEKENGPFFLTYQGLRKVVFLTYESVGSVFLPTTVVFLTYESVGSVFLPTTVL